MNTEKLFNKDFTLVVIGQVISLFGAAVLRFALSTYILDITGRSDLFALVFAISAIPAVILSPLGGAIADRFNRRNLMVIFDFASSGIVLFSALLLGLGLLNVLSVGIIMTLLAIISFIYQPAVQASIPRLQKEENLETANGIVTGVAALSSLAGPVAGGIFYGIWGLDKLILISCSAFFISAVMEIFIHIPFSKRTWHKPIFATLLDDIKEGASYVTKTKPQISKIMILAALLNLFLVPFFIVGLPFILRVTMSAGDSMFGLGLGIIELSSLLGALSTGLVAKKMKISTLHRWLALIAVLFIPMSGSLLPTVLDRGFYPAFIWLYAFIVPIVLITTMLTVFVITSIQKETPNIVLGKVMAIITAVAQCAAPIGQILYGTLVEAFKTAVYIPALSVSLVLFIITFLTKRLLNPATKLETKPEIAP